MILIVKESVKKPTMKQRLSESRMREIIRETVHKHLQHILTEGRNAEKAKAQTIQVIRNFFCDTDSNQSVDAEEIENKFKEWLFHANISDAVIRLEPIMMNIALQLGYNPYNSDNADLSKLNRLGSIVEYIKLNYKKEGFPIPLNKLTLGNTTFDSLNQMFGKIVDDETDKDNEEANSLNGNTQMNPNYEIIEVKDYDTAHEIGNYSCSKSKLCYTQDEATFDEYTRYDVNKVYAILRKNYKDIPEERGENTPYDEYGLSMIFLFIRPDGNIAYSNTRWNHQTLGKGPSNVDQSFKKSDISKLLGVNFDETFKPNVIDYSNYELLTNFNKKNGWAKVYNATYDCVNFVNKDGEFISKQWFDNCENFYENNKVTVWLNEKCNLMNVKGEFLSKIWFDDIEYLLGGYSAVTLDNKVNIVNSDFKFISDIWFDDCDGFKDGWAPVTLNNKSNYINPNGEYLSDQWFDYCGIFDDGIAKVGLNNRYNYINTKGEFIFDQWFDNRYDALVAYQQYQGQHQNENRLRNQWLSAINEWNDRLTKAKIL